MRLRKKLKNNSSFSISARFKISPCLFVGTRHATDDSCGTGSRLQDYPTSLPQTGKYRTGHNFNRIIQLLFKLVIGATSA